MNFGQTCLLSAEHKQHQKPHSFQIQKVLKRKILVPSLTIETHGEAIICQEGFIFVPRRLLASIVLCTLYNFFLVI